MEELKFARNIFRMFQAFLLEYFELNCCSTFKDRRLFCLIRQNIFSLKIRRVNLSNITSFWELRHLHQRDICLMFSTFEFSISTRHVSFFTRFLQSKRARKKKGFTFYVKNVLSVSRWVRLTRDSHLSSLSRKDGKKLWTERDEKLLMNIYSSKNKQKLSVCFFLLLPRFACSSREKNLGKSLHLISS